MPVPKGKQELYGKVVGRNINAGKSLAAAKKIADRAIASEQRKNDEAHKAYRSDHEPPKPGRPRENCKVCGCCHSDGSWH